MPIDELVESIIPSSEELEKAIKCNQLICVSGPPAVGKTTMTRVVLERYKDLFISSYIDCYDVATPTQLYTNICSAFHCELNITKKYNEGKYVRFFQVGQTVLGQDFPKFCEEYHNYANKRGFKKLFVTLDHIECLRGTTMMDSIALLLTVPHLNMIWITCKSPTDIITYISNYSPGMSIVAQDKTLHIYVGCWSRADLIKVVLNSPPKEHAELYKTFVNNVVNLVYVNHTRSIRDIKLYCQEHFKGFLEYYEKRLREKVKDDYGPDVSLDDLSDIDVARAYTPSLISSFLKSLKNMVRQYGLSGSHSEEQEQSLKLPLNTATLLIAAYIAAITKPSDDKRNFVKCQKKKAERATSKSEKKSKQFTLERLIHIYLSLLKISTGTVGEDLNIIQNNDIILSDIERLESLNILKLCGGDGISSDSRFKLSSNIRRDYIDKAAIIASINLDYICGI